MLIMKITLNSKLIFAIIAISFFSIIFFNGNTFAQNNKNSLSGVYGCTMREDRWGRAPDVQANYDGSNLVWILDASNSTISGVDLRYKFQGVSGNLGSLVRQPDAIYKDFKTEIIPTELMNTYKLKVDEGEYVYLVAVNSGNSLLVNGAHGSRWVSQSGMCQKM